MFEVCDHFLRNKLKNSLPTGFEPVRENPNRFQVCRLNHSAIAAHIAIQSIDTSSFLANKSNRTTLVFKLINLK
jgi:hypothetical protein